MFNMTIIRCSCPGTTHAGPSGSTVLWLLLKILWSEGCLSLVAKYANAIGLSGGSVTRLATSLISLKQKDGS